MIKISVVVCTYNRADIVQSAIESLCSQGFNRSLYEIIVVDNNSTDNTRCVVEGFLNYGNVRYVFEKEPGASHARNAGWRVAAGEYVGFSDDDCRVSENWLEVAEKIIRTNSPDIFGGPFFPFYRTERPAWYKDEYGSFYPNTEPKILSGPEYLCGTNFFLRRRFLDEFGGFDTDLGPHGDVLGYGEETALIQRIRNEKADAKVLYDPELLVYHLVTRSKMKMGYLMNSIFIVGRYSNYVFFNRKTALPHRFICLLQVLCLALYIPADCMFGLLFRDRKKFPLFFNYVYEHTVKYVYILGTRYERVVQKIGKKDFAS